MIINLTLIFSIAKWTGTGANGTIGHGLSAAPEIMFVKGLDNTDHWFVYSSSLTTSQYIYLNLTNSITSGANAWNSTAPTNSVFSIGDDGGVNGSLNDYIAYCWHSVEGFSKFGSYVGNDSTDGIFVYTGFQPAFIMVKRTDSSGTGWIMMDNARDTYNVMNNNLAADTDGVENSERSTMPVDFLSNGFKWRINYSDVNGASGGSYHTYIYIAFAETPMNNLYGAQSNAR